MVNSTSTRRSVTHVLIPICRAGPEVATAWIGWCELGEYGARTAVVLRRHDPDSGCQKDERGCVPSEADNA